MRVDVLYSAGCPGYERALALLREVLREEAVEADITLHHVRTPEEAEALQFPGSPTIRIEGHDVDALPGDVAGLCCRAYRQGDGSLAPVPPREGIETAVRTVLERQSEREADSCVNPLAPGEAAPDFVLPATDGQVYSLASFSASSYLAIAFLANHCPYSAAWEGRLAALGRRYVRKGVAFAAISSSVAACFPADTLEHMAARARDRRFPFPYLHDEDQGAARAFGATHTPQVFLFDADRRLRYSGAIDSDWEGGPAMVHYLRDAIDALLSGQEISTPITVVRGSRIRYRSIEI